MSIKNTFRSIVAIATLGLLVLAAFWLTSERSRIVQEKKEQISHAVDIVHGLLADYHRMELAHQLSREEAQRRALTLIRSLRYGEDSYFWINDLQRRMIMHPTRPALDGTLRPDPFMTDTLRVVGKSGGGFIEYLFPRPGRPAQETVRKLSFVKAYAPWGWIVGTGIYIDDVDAAWRHNAVRAVAVTLACGMVLLCLSIVTFRSFFRRLGSVVQRMDKVARCRGDFTSLFDLRRATTGSANRDEVGVLIRGFNEMLWQIQRRDHEIERHTKHLENVVGLRTEELSTANAKLATAYTEIQLFLESIPSILIGLDTQGIVTRWNSAAGETLQVPADQALGHVLHNCGVRWVHPDFQAEVFSWLSSTGIRRSDSLAYERDGEVRFLGLTIRPIRNDQKEITGFLITGADITERKCLEEQLRQSQKLEAIGQLAAGVAHEINTPTQYVTDNTRFLKESWASVQGLLALCDQMRAEAMREGFISVTSLARFDEASCTCELGYLKTEVPTAIDQSLEGLGRVAKIVRAMKDFAHPGGEGWVPVDISKAIESTITLSRGEWKHVAEVVTDFDDGLPLVPCFASEVNETILNLIVNAAHAVADVVGSSGEKGRIVIATRRHSDSVVISVRDSGTGIPPEIRSRVFEPFFTTKPMGKGTGQGLALSHSMIVKKHGGQIWFETEVGQGTTFFIQLPLSQPTAKATPEIQEAR